MQKSNIDAQQKESAPAVARRSRWTDLRVVVAAAAGLTICGYFAFEVLHANEQATNNAQIQCEVVPVPAQVSGIITSIAFKDNQLVKAGDVLAKIDPAMKEARLKQAEAALLSAQLAARSADAAADLAAINARGDRQLTPALIQASQAAVASTNLEIDQSAADIKALEVTRNEAEADLKRKRELNAVGVVTQAALEVVESKFRVAEANLLATKARRDSLSWLKAAASARADETRKRAEVTAAVENVIVARAEAERNLAHARVESAAAERDAAALELSYTTISAMRSGTASERTVNVGQMVEVGQPIVSIVTCVERVWVEANFKETQVGKMRPGQRATVSVDAYSDLLLEGEVENLSGATGATFSLLPPENATGNFTKVVQRIPVRIRLDNVPEANSLRVGMSVIATVHQRHQNSAWEPEKTSREPDRVAVQIAP